MSPSEPRPLLRHGLAVAVTAALLGAPAAQANEERFRLSPGSVMQNDDAGADGTIGHAKGLGYEVMQGYAVAEGDMVLGRVDARGRLEAFRQRGLAQRNRLDRWLDGVVPYTFHEKLTDVQRRNVEEAIDRLNEKTRILLVPADAPEASAYEDYVRFEPSSGCASFVGRQPGNDRFDPHVQSLWVADSCSVGSIVHEIAHAIGLFHEHTRPDRDNKVTVVWDEIVDDKAFNFEIYEAGAESWGDYDYESIMHYGEYFFSRRGERTIIAPPNVDIGQRVALSEGDIDAIDRMYATDLAVDATTHVSERGLEIDLSITNNGDLGARGLTLRVLGERGTDWLSISAQSGWDCLAFDEELRCERTRLIEQASSRFTVVADASTTTAEGVSFRLESVTLDTDPGNNGAGAGAFGDSEGPSAPSLFVPPAAARPDPNEPASGAAEPISRSAIGGTVAPASDASGGGGAGGPFAALVLLGLAAIRRRVR